MTGARVKRVEHYLGDADLFLVHLRRRPGRHRHRRRWSTFHRSHGRLATVTGVTPPSRFGELVARRRSR